MDLLPAIPAVLLFVVAVWLFWPAVADPITRARARRSRTDADRVADSLFAVWSEQGDVKGLLVRPQRG